MSRLAELWREARGDFMGGLTLTIVLALAGIAYTGFTHAWEVFGLWAIALFAAATLALGGVIWLIRHQVARVRARRLAALPPPWPPPIYVPPPAETLPPWHVPRPHERDKLLRALGVIGDTAPGQAVVLTAAIQGMGSVGKTVLAASILRAALAALDGK